MGDFERWAAIPGTDGRYEASSAGRVRSMRLVNGAVDVARSVPRILSTTKQLDGYLRVGIRLNGRYRGHGVHRLVLLAFVGAAQPGLEASHLDGNPENNSLSNLRWETRRMNHLRKYYHRTARIGEKSNLSKLTEQDVFAILRRRASGETCKSIARDFRVSRNYVGQICSGKAWLHVSDAEKYEATLPERAPVPVVEGVVQ